jgi:hypothetical protein
LKYEEIKLIFLKKRVHRYLCGLPDPSGKKGATCWLVPSEKKALRALHPSEKKAA